MSRPLRIQYANAWYHVMNRGRRGETIFKEKIALTPLMVTYSEEEELLASRRGRPNEARNVAIYLLRQLRGSKLKEIGTEFGINSYSTVSTIIKRTRNEIPKNRRLRKRIEQLRSELVLSQEQTP